MSREILGSFVYTIILIIMISSGLWVMLDCRRRGRPWSETLAWGLFAGWFFGVGLIVYFLWNRKFPR
ncbi:MAG: hypothetical protein ACOY40_05265 [Bacillota bacterium]